MIKYIKKYGSTINEQVNEIDGTYIISGVRIKKSVVTSYKRKVKEQTGKDLGQMYSDSQIAEELITYIVTKNADAEFCPTVCLKLKAANDRVDSAVAGQSIRVVTDN